MDESKEQEQQEAEWQDNPLYQAPGEGEEDKPGWQDNPLYQAPQGEAKIDQHGKRIFPDPEGAAGSSSSGAWGDPSEEDGSNVPAGDEEDLQWHENPLYEPPSGEEEEQSEEEGE